MSASIIGLLAVIFLIIFIYTRMWVGLVMLIVGFWGLVAVLGLQQSLTLLSIVPFRAVADYTFAALPLFLLMGTVVYNAGFAQDLFNSAYKWIGQLKGGLAMATCVASAVLGVITDSVVSVLTIGRVAITEMRKHNYDDSLATASVVAGASLSSLVPPSVGFIIYAVLVGESIGKLYIGAIIPGIVLMLMMLLVIAILAKINPLLAPAGPRISFQEKTRSLTFTWPVILLFIVILAGIYAGVFTPTEAGAIGATCSIILGLINRRLGRQTLLKSFLETAQMTAMMVLMMGSAFVFAHLMTVSKLPFMLSDFIAGLHLSRYIVLFVVILVYILLGMFCDIITAMLITTPIIYPVIISLGFDSVWFGILIVLLVEMGLITPPIGMNVFVLSGVTDIPVDVIFKRLWPFVAVILLFVAIMTIFPQIVLFLPSTM